MEKPNRSREDGERIKAGNLRVLVSSGGGLTSWPTCDPEAECWLSRTTKQFTPYLLRWPRISQKRCSEPGWLRTNTARWYSSHNIYCEAHAVWEEAELTFLPQTLVGPASSAVGLRVTEWLTAYLCRDLSLWTSLPSGIPVRDPLCCKKPWLHFWENGPVLLSM